MLKRILPFLFFSGFTFLAQAQSQPEPISTFSEPSKAGKYINITEIGFARGIIHENSDQSFGFQTINGIEFGNKVSFGIGVGAEKYLGKGLHAGKTKHLTLLPAFTDVRVYFGKGKFQPYFGQSVGYAFCIDQPIDYNYYAEYDEKGGIMLSPSFGLRTNREAKVNFTMSLGYRYQENTQEITRTFANPYYYGYYFSDGSQFKRFDHYLTIKFGLTF